MNIRTSLRSKLIAGFVAVAVPLIILLLYNNLYASDVVREQVAETNKKLLMLYSNRIEAALSTQSNYLYNLATQDSNFAALAANADDPDQYFYAKNALYGLLSSAISYHDPASMFFVYYKDKSDFFSTTVVGLDNYEQEEALEASIRGILEHMKEGSAAYYRWNLLEYAGQHALIRIVPTEFGSYIGTVVILNRLMIPLDLIQAKGEGFAMFVSEEGKALTSGSIGDLSRKQLEAIPYDPSQFYQTVQGGKESYIAVSNPLPSAGLRLVVLIPDRQLLQQLPYFKKLIYIVPIGGGILLLLYLFFLNRGILRPINELTRGMRRIKQGDLNVRLPEDQTKDFVLINETFNEMVGQIQKLTIDVYEEQIKAHKAELKHLQVQINPHFLLNSINIIYSLSKMKNNDLIEQMSLHLVKYFRFVTRTNVSQVTLAEELEHLDSYFRIQQLRFPDHMTYRIAVDSVLRTALTPPLILQPFVENSMKHGFEMGDQPFHIAVDVKVDEQDCYEATIADNGSGFAEDILPELQSGRYFAGESDLHLGIWNVHHRLMLQYPEASVVFENAPEGGAVVRIRIPIQHLEGVHHV